jgi:hypothetical protein
MYSDDAHRDTKSSGTSLRKLVVIADAPSLSRHPNDGWQPADPYPMASFVRRALRAVVLALCPPPPAPQLPDLVPRIELHVRSFMSYMHPLAARGLWLAILLLDWAPRVLFKSVHRLQGLDRERGAHILEAMTKSRVNIVRTLVVAVRGLVLCAYFDQDEVHEALNYRPIPFLRNRLARRQELLRPAHARAG